MTRSLMPLSSTLVTAGALALSLTVTPAMAAFVDCASDSPGKIQEQLDAGETKIAIKGTCFEDINVVQDQTTFEGHPYSAGPNGITGQIIMDSVQRIVFMNLTLEGFIGVAEGSTVEFNNIRITGPGDLSIGNNSVAQLFNGTSVEDKDGGVNIVDGAVIQMDDVPIRNITGSVFIANGANAQIRGGEIIETENGISIVRGSVARFSNVTLGPARDDSSASCAPLCLGDMSDVRLDNTHVSGTNNNPAIGGAVNVFRNASLLIRGNSSVVNSGSQPAIGIFHDSIVRQDGGDGPISINGGVQLFGASYGDFRNAVINGGVNVDLKSVFRFRSTDPGNPSVLNGNVTLTKGSTMDATSPPATVHGNVVCQDDSVLYGRVLGSGKRRCDD